MRSLLLAVALALSSGSAAQTVSTVATDIQGSGGLATGPDGLLYLSDFGSSLKQAGGRGVYRMSADGSERSLFSGGFGGASGNAFAADGTLYQSDVARGEVARITPDGERAVFGRGLKTPVGIAPDGQGGAFVAECIANAISHVASDGSKRRVASGAPLNCPNGLILAPDGGLYSVNFNDGAVVRIDRSGGEMAVAATIPGGGNGHLSWANGRLYVASFRGHRIYSVDGEGAICLIAGSGAKGNADGEQIDATFFRPNGIAITRDGDTLYTNTVTSIVERDSPLLHLNAVRKVTGLKRLLDCPAERLVKR